MNGSTALRTDWGKQLAIAAAYAACYEVARHVSFSHWILVAGLRLACLLLVPVRYWPALVLGETLPIVESALIHAPQFGAPWAVSASVPIMLPCMALILPMRRHWLLRSHDGQLKMGLVMAATLACAVITAAFTTLTLITALVTHPGSWSDISVPTYFWAYLLGAYLGALTLTPSILALHERAEAQGRVTFDAIRHSPLLRDLLTWALPLLAGMAWLALATDDDTVRLVARLAMTVPVIGMAVRHGSHGSAIGGMFASVALATTGTVLLDPAMIRSQVVLALVISGSLLAGARVPYRATRPDAMPSLHR